MISPRIQVLETKIIERVLEEAYNLLWDVGVLFGSDCSDEPLRLLDSAGAEVDFNKREVKIPASLIDNARQFAPSEITIYDQEGNEKMNLGGDNMYYYPTSTGMTIWDADTNTLRNPATDDFIKFIKIVEGLPHSDAQSSALYCHDVPREVADSYRNYLLLKYGRKPVVTGAYSAEGQKLEIEMFAALCGGSDSLAAKPLVVNTVCPSPPLKWSYTADSLIIAAKAGVPTGIGPMPLSGGTGPVTLIGTIVQHTAEALSGLVLSQIAAKGAPVLWFNPTSIFDMGQGTTPLGAIETHLIMAGTNEIAKYLNIPSLNYFGVSDSKMVDAQQAMETTCGIILSALCRSNLNGSLGMIDFESGQSYEGLIISNEAVGIAKRLVKGINVEMNNLGSDAIRQVGHSGNFMELDHTLQWFRKELSFPGIVDRKLYDNWKADGSKDMVQRARERVQELVSQYKQPEKSQEAISEIENIMSRACSKYGLETLPDMAAV